MRTSGHRAARAGPTCAFVLRVTVAVLVVALWCAGRTLGSGDGDGRDSQHAHVDVSAALHDDPASAATPHYLWAIPADTAARGEEGVGVPSDVDPVAAASAAAAAEAVAEAGGAAGVGVPAGNTGVARHGGGSVDGSHATQAAFKLRIPNRVKGWFQYLVNAQAHIERGRLDDAIDNYQRALDGYRLPPQDAQAVHLALGRVLVNMSLLTQAQRSFSLAAGIKVQQHVPQFWLGVTAAKQARLDDAKQHLRNALFYAPDFFPALHNLGSLLLIQGDMDSGLYYYNAALSRVDKSLVAHEANEMPMHDVLPVMVQHVLSAFQGDRRFTDAEVAAALKLFQDHFHSLDLQSWHLRLGLALMNVGAHAEGAAHMEVSRQYEVEPTWVGSFLSLALPVVHESADAMTTAWERLSSGLAAQLYDASARLDRLHTSPDTYHTTYQLPFMGLPSRQIMVDMARLSLRNPTIGVTSPLLGATYTLPQPSAPASQAAAAVLNVLGAPTVEPVARNSRRGAARSNGEQVDGRIHVGILSSQLYDCPTGQLVLELVRHLARKPESSPSPAVGGDSDGDSSTDGRDGSTDGRDGSTDGRDGSTDGRDGSAGLDTVPRVSPMQLARARRALKSRQRRARGGGGGATGTSGVVEPAVLADVLDGELHQLYSDAQRAAHVDGLPPAPLWRPWEASGDAPVGAASKRGTLDRGRGRRRRRGRRQRSTRRSRAAARGAQDGTGVDGTSAGSSEATAPRELSFKVTIVLPRPVGDQVTRGMLDHAHRLVKLDVPRNLTQWHERLAAEKFDVLLVFHDGLDAFVHTALGARLAPVQVMYWAFGTDHVLTSGFGDVVDYQVTVDELVPPGIAGAAHGAMDEQLVRLGGLGMVLQPPTALDPVAVHNTVVKHSLFNERHLYLCPVVLAHLHPEFDAVIGGVLDRDPVAEVMVFYEPDQELWLERTRQRLFSHPHVAQDGNFRRVRFVRQPPHDELLALAVSAEVVLSPFPVGIGHLALELMARSVPVISCAHPSALRNTAAAAARRLGVTELVASSASDMVRVAVDLGSDELALLAVKLRLGREAHRLFWHAGGEPGSDTAPGEAHVVDAASARGLLGKPVLVTTPAVPTAATGAVASEKSRTLGDWSAFLQRVGGPWATQRALAGSA